MTTIEKFVDLCGVISNDNEKFDIWQDYLENYKDDNDYVILKEKVDNFLRLLNEDKDTWFDKDIETEIYPNI